MTRGKVVGVKAITVWTILFALVPLGAARGYAQSQPASFDAATRVFRLDGGRVTYAFGVNREGQLQTVYWGGRLREGDPLPQPSALKRSFELTDTPQEFAGWGGGLTIEPAVKITFPDGNRDLVLHYVSHEMHGDEISVKLKDIERDVYVTLHYKMDAQTGILSRWAEVSNQTHAALMVEQMESGTWNLPRSSSYSLRTLSGRWGGEDQVQDRPLAGVETVLESRRGFTGHEFVPWFAVSEDPSVSETAGRVWFGALGWSGSWRITVQQDVLQQVRITGGFNPFDFAYPLEPGESLQSPEFYGGFSASGYEEMSRLESEFQRTKILPSAPHPRLRPVLYNSWEATGFRVSEEGQGALAEKAASIGVERFVMDDGWFSTRKDDHAGLGDWYPDPEKFPHGLKPLIDRVHGLGMDFGLWVEPEMVNEKSDLYRKHPEWILHFNGRPQTEGRSQFVLNLAIPQVREYVFGVLDKLLGENDIAFLKWDANRNWSEPGWPEVSAEKQKTVYVKYIENYYSILRDLRAKHPAVEIESCSGGGGRVDLGVMRYTDEVWPSDNTDPFDRLTIQDGFSYAYTPQVMMAWVTDSPNWYDHRSTTLDYRFLSAMQGSLGIGADLNKWTPQDFTTAKKMVAEYKAIREVIQQGELHRLSSPRAGSNFAATESVSADKSRAVVFAFLHAEQMQYPAPIVRPRGLEEDSMYLVRAFSGSLDAATPTRASGAYWMQHGLSFRLEGDYAAAAAVFEKQP